MESFCHKPWENLLVEVNGDCYFCCFIIRPGGKIGNLRKDKFDRIWTSRKANLIRKSIIRGRIPYYCQKCPFHGEFKHKKFFHYKIYFLTRKMVDYLSDFWHGGFTRYRIKLKLKKSFTFFTQNN